MSLFGGRSNYSTMEAPVFEGYDCLHNGDLRAIEEGYEDQLAIIEAIHEIDMAELDYNRDLKSLNESYGDIDARTNQYTVALEGLVANAWEKIKKFFTNMWGKLKAFFDSVVRFFDSLFKSGKDFAEKYEKQLDRLSLTGYKFKMYDYSVESQVQKASDIFSAIQKFLENKKIYPTFALSAENKDVIEKTMETMSDDKENILDEFRGTMCGESSANKEEYSKKLFGLFRSGATSENDKKDVSVDIKKVIADLKNTKISEAVNKTITDMNTVFTNYLKTLTTLENKISDSTNEKPASFKEGNITHTSATVTNMKGEATEYVRKCSTFFSECKEIALENFRTWKEAITERNTVYKSVCVGAFRYKKQA